MNRHHPYGGGYDGPRRGGPPGNFGPGPDRSHRYDRGGGPRGRGFGRGRGGSHGSYGGYGNAAQYDQGPPQGQMGGYNNYQTMPPQDPFYQNGNYSAPGPGQYNAPDPNGSFDQGYGYEDGAGQNYNQGGGFGRFQQQKRPQRREREEKVPDSVIEERLQRERPCRTLFIRNIKYETSSDHVRGLFEEHGEIKTFFDLIANRGMVFVTYYDLRAAERARERLQGSEISGRPIDVHYSLPRDDNGKGADRQREQELQGTLLVTLRNSSTNQPIDEGEVHRKFQQFGDVKSVRPGDRPDQCYVEFYDTRASEEAHDRLRHQGLQDGIMEIVFAASGTDDPRGGSPRRERDDHGGFERQRDWEEPSHRGGRRGGRGGRGRGRGYGGGGGGGGGDDWGDRRDWNRDRNRSNEDEFGRAPRGGDFNSNRGGRNGPGGYGGGSGPGYGGSSAPSFGRDSSAPAEAADERERLEQAKKVQQLLAALKQPQGTTAASGAPPAAPPAAPPSMPQMQPSPAAPPTSYYNQPPVTLPPQPPSYASNSAPAQPVNPYASLTPQPPAPQPAQPAPTASLAGLPPNILALLQQGSQAQPQPAQSAAPPPPMPPYSMPPASAMIGAQQGQQQPSIPGMPPTNAAQPGYQQIMAFLQSQKR
ncbi:hypothetical protein C8Q77DRAFT_1083485 [Trametes polyzona]|nr:hypothetical protein C8Q77DRAFT_1083485 [Trametes polyzona]